MHGMEDRVRNPRQGGNPIIPRITVDPSLPTCLLHVPPHLPVEILQKKVMRKATARKLEGTAMKANSTKKRFRMWIGFPSIITVMSGNFTTVPEWDLSLIFSFSPCFILISRTIGGVFIFYFQEEFVNVWDWGFLENLEEFACKIAEAWYFVCGKIFKYSFNLFNAYKTVQAF